MNSRNHFNLRPPGFGGRGSCFAGNGGNAGEIAADVDLQFAVVRREDDLLRFFLQRLMEFLDLGAIEVWTCNSLVPVT